MWWSLVLYFKYLIIELSFVTSTHTTYCIFGKLHEGKEAGYTVKKQDLSFSEKLLFDLCVARLPFPREPALLPPDKWSLPVDCLSVLSEVWATGVPEACIAPRCDVISLTCQLTCEAHYFPWRHSYLLRRFHVTSWCLDTPRTISLPFSSQFFVYFNFFWIN